MLSWSPAPAATGPYVCCAGKTRSSFLRSLLGRCAGLLEIKHLQGSGYWFLKSHGGGASLWSQVVAPAHARCVFYCFLIIVQLLLGRIYWNRQPARLLTAYEADTSCVTLRRGGRGQALSLPGRAEDALRACLSVEPEAAVWTFSREDEWGLLVNGFLCFLHLYVLQEHIF